MNTTACLDTFPSTEELYAVISADIVSIVFLTIACILAVISVGIFVEELVFLYGIHKGHTVILRKVAVILGLYPITVFTSVISLLVPRSTLILDLVASSYLSVCFYTFVTLTVDFFGGEDRMLELLSEHKLELSVPPCCCCCYCMLKPITLSRKTLFYFKIFALQVAVVRPALLFITIVIWSDGKYKNSLDATSSYLYISIITTISTLLSLYGTAVIVRGSRQHLQKYSLLMKYWSFNLMLILINLQKLMFAILEVFGIPKCIGSRGTKVRGSALHNALLIIEAFLLMLLARKAYRMDDADYEDPFSTQTIPSKSKIIDKQPGHNSSIVLVSVDGPDLTNGQTDMRHSGDDSKGSDDSDSTLLHEQENGRGSDN